MKRLWLWISVLASTSSIGCMTAYYEFWDLMGVEKRDLLIDNVEHISKQQKEVQEEFEDALTRIRKLYGLEASELQEVYDGMKQDYEQAERKVDALHARIEKVVTIGDDLFAEWGREAKSIKTRSLREDSLAKLGNTQKEFERLKVSLRKSERTLDPVLAKFRDHVLYLKHSLNAQALGSLKQEVVSIEGEIKALIRQMEQSIQASDRFVKTLSV